MALTILRLLLLCLFIGFSAEFEDGAQADQLTTPPSLEATLAEARKSGKLVILDLEAVWCHWCHVMEENTYGDSAVAARIKKDYLFVRVDQDSRPDLSNRYEDYGWPATIIFDSRGVELVKRSGYIAPEDFASILGELTIPAKRQARALQLASPRSRKPTEPGKAPENALLDQRISEDYDSEHGGWKGGHKYLERYFLEYELERARQGDKEARARVLQTLAGAGKLIDPAWGGAYQYSVDGDWKNPHFEKIMAVQADFLAGFARAFAILGRSQDRDSALKIASYLRTFWLDPSGAYFTSQDADVVPGEHSGIDRHLYARENGWLAEAWLRLHEATGDMDALKEAERIGHWLLQKRKTQAGGYLHGEDTSARLFLGDTLASGKTFLALYAATSDRAWLAHAEAAARFMEARFSHAGAGFLSSEKNPDSPLAPVPQADENIALARFANLLHHYTGSQTARLMAEKARQFTRLPVVTERPYTVFGSGLVEDEMSKEPLHITIVGAKGDPASRALFQAAVNHPVSYKRVEWWDRAEGKLPRGDVTYPELKEPAAFLCSASRCSLPIKDPARLKAFLEKPEQP